MLLSQPSLIDCFFFLSSTYIIINIIVHVGVEAKFLFELFDIIGYGITYIKHHNDRTIHFFFIFFLFQLHTFKWGTVNRFFTLV
jgi:hypothetical protein